MHKTTLILLLLISSLIFQNYSYTNEIKSTDNQADYIIITHPKFENDLQQLIDLRVTSGLVVQTISLNQIISEYQDALAISPPFLSS